jgi:hypothetical protein
MNYHFITYSDTNYKTQQSRLQESVKGMNTFSTIQSYSDEWLKHTDFYTENKAVLDLKRGAGYWLWKPYIILDCLKRINEGDIVFYLDCGDFFRKEIVDYVNPILENEFCLLLGGSYMQKHWTKRDCFQLMNCDSVNFTDVNQIEAGVQFWKNQKRSIAVLEEQINWCKDYRILTDSPNECGLLNYPGFQDHRHDQSVLTNLFVKHQLAVDSQNHQTPYTQMRNFVRCNII